MRLDEEQLNHKASFVFSQEKLNLRKNRLVFVRIAVDLLVVLLRSYHAPRRELIAGHVFGSDWKSKDAVKEMKMDSGKKEEDGPEVKQL